MNSVRWSLNTAAVDMARRMRYFFPPAPTWKITHMISTECEQCWCWHWPRNSSKSISLPQRGDGVGGWGLGCGESEKISLWLLPSFLLSTVYLYYIFLLLDYTLSTTTLSQNDQILMMLKTILEFPVHSSQMTKYPKQKWVLLYETLHCILIQ